MNRPYQWQAVGGRLHAIPNTRHDRYPPLPGTTYPLLCGGNITLEQEDFRQGTHAAMCDDCLTAWNNTQTTHRPAPALTP